MGISFRRSVGFGKRMNTVSRSLKNIAVFEMHINQEALQLEECYGKV